jgi:glycosyltransferase involved in cell wall biosynthesis
VRILLVTQFYPPVIGGEERHVRALAGALAGRGHHVAVATLATGDDAGVAHDDGVEVHRIRGTAQRFGRLFTDPSRPHVPPFPDPGLRSALLAVIRGFQPDVVHAHNWLVHSLPRPEAMGGVPVVLTLHDYSQVCVQKRLMRNGVVCEGPSALRCTGCAVRHYGPVVGLGTLAGAAIVRRSHTQRLDGVLCVSEAVRRGNGLESRGVPGVVVPNFIPDHVAVDRNDPRLAALPSEPFVLFVGDLSPDKGVGVLMEAFGMLRRDHDVPLVCIGRRVPDTPALHPDITLIEGWPHPLVMAAFERATMSVAPSIWGDPCPTVAMEAMAVGCPVVASRIGGLADIVEDGRSGVLVPPGDAAALAGEIAALLSDPSRRRALAAGALARAVAYRASTVVPGIESQYLDLLDRADRRTST